MRRFFLSAVIGLYLVAGWFRPILAEGTGGLEGTVRLERSEARVGGLLVLLEPVGRVTETDEDGYFTFSDLDPGTYEVVVQGSDRWVRLGSARRTVDIRPGAVSSLDLHLRLSPLKEKVVVTAVGKRQTAFEAFQSVSSLDFFDLSERAAVSLGDVLDLQPGVAKRSFGPGSTRPIIRGFDGDRVLILQDGLPTGSLSSTSGDHGEPIEVLSLQRLEVVKGPSTLLYGGSAVGGVVNAVRFEPRPGEAPAEGLRGHLVSGAGSSDAYGGGGLGFEYGRNGWLFGGALSGHRTGDYRTPVGRVENSGTHLLSGSFEGGLQSGSRFFRLGYEQGGGRYGVPFADALIIDSLPDEEDPVEVDLVFRRHKLRLDAGTGWVDGPFRRVRFSLGLTDWVHDELEDGELETVFKNRQVSYRVELEPKGSPRRAATFGVWGLHRTFEATGVEALAPPVRHDGVALFALQELSLEPFRLQFAGRLEHTKYVPEGLTDRSFTGFSGAAGIHLPLWKGGAFVSHFSHSFRAPALEELYNYGAHIGNLTFEIGNPLLNRERARGVEGSLRHGGEDFRAEANLFHYNLSDFVFLAPTGRYKEGLMVGEYLQGAARFAGSEVSLDLRLHDGLWLGGGFDRVSARLEDGSPLPRIPPLRGRLGLESHFGNWTLRPQLVVAAAQRSVFANETPTAGYSTAQFQLSYTLAEASKLHRFSVSLFNLTDRLYRNHSSFIKDLAAEPGRGIRFTYLLRFF